MSVLWQRKEVEAALGVKTTQDFGATGVALDSRELCAGDLFIALKGPNHDGAHYVSQAFAKGAAAAVLPQGTPVSYPQEPCLYVTDTLEALRDLARVARHRTCAKVIGVTGSFGKTSVKDAIRLVLATQGSVTASERSFNNHWGVPLTLATLNPQDDYGVIEMGMNHAGEIESSSELVQPHVALITTIREMHMQALGSLEAIADAKSEIFTGMASGGVAVLNADDVMFERVFKAAQRHQLEVISFGRTSSATLRLSECRYEKGRLSIRADLAGQSREFSVPGLGEHWALNILGILGVMDALRIDLDQAIEALQNYRVPEGRGVQHRVPYQGGEILLIDESYNAGPDSMRAALKVLGNVKLSEDSKQGRRIAILGDMRELGAYALEQHQSLRDVLVANRIDLVFTCGVMMKHLYDVLPPTMKGGHAEEVEDLVPVALKAIQAGDVVMSKGSKGQYAQRGRMYGFVDAILGLADAMPEEFQDVGERTRAGQIVMSNASTA
ncbi:MAG: UDP-N-acetylmuramoyl-tripeptide--D-alanyl-D-alanine ligase [Caedimonas sp.]|nr:UDP-N-acetylmuramoyl-tripeptide--D-alanyl-D-alanine ligase [Caedimonas sp.]